MAYALALVPSFRCRLPVAFICFLERALRDSTNGLVDRALCGSFLFMITAFLKFSDAAHISWDSLSLDGLDVRCVVHKTKTSVSGMPVAACGLAVLGPLPDQAQRWPSVWLCILEYVWSQVCVTQIRFFLPGTVSSFALFLTLKLSDACAPFLCIHAFSPSCIRWVLIVTFGVFRATTKGLAPEHAVRTQSGRSEPSESFLQNCAWRPAPDHIGGATFRNDYSLPVMFQVTPLLPSANGLSCHASMPPDAASGAISPALQQPTDGVDGLI